jgi:hypothetical protein
VIDIEQRSLRTLEQERFPVIERVPQYRPRIADERAQPLSRLEIAIERPGHRNGVIIVTAKQTVFVPQFLPEKMRKSFPVEQEIDHSHSAPADLVPVGGHDPFAGTADTALPLSLLRPGVQKDVVRQHDVRLFADENSSLYGDPALNQLIDFLQELQRVDHHSATEYTTYMRIEDAGRDQMELECVSTYHDGVARIGTALKSYYEIGSFGEMIDDLSFSLVSPLSANHKGYWHVLSLPVVISIQT